ncbi:MAG TPA: LutB/LldF family L-lactate oxidation iron-sulfur protein [Aggregatilinea sp.]|jgi:L-lactate dehydrogenase complex protein LldF|uniref:LutB/LldF family L-lactate oxidation iron-sulfur protein n=1 Tax=Aggregatilinea sp. TaxID=2806333 RepID=UPI002C57846E|nr:LutB/LldF family L-lactate oxidation iron-sulfur protein [Aggregatilinea sp.]HML24910.1 LutB/LldF family L-lactate oxidation iron-sulfur protein [Aggregatilinea sp.]
MSEPNVGATFPQFRTQAIRAIHDPMLQRAIDGATLNFRTGRASALEELPDADVLRDHFKTIRSSTLARLADHLETFERNATAAGAQVHWARDAAEARGIVLSIARDHGADLVVKSKSMASEEIHLNQALAAAGIDPVETDLGEWIIQLAGETPAHIVGPALHKTREQVAELFSQEAGRVMPPDDIPGMTELARGILREKFLAAGIGISGGNIAVAETGTVVLVTNEGNGRLVTSAPPVHIAVVGIEKVAPTWDDAAAWLQLLARSATGQPLSIYTTAITGPARADDPDGPQEVHVVFLDNGRSRQLGTQYEEVLQCIRCGACLNACPVYQEVGGHTYGHPYSGPIGAVLVPLMFGLEEYAALPHASSLCGACLEACPARIDIPRMLLALRAEEVQRHVVSRPEHFVESAAATVMAHPRLYRTFTALGRFFQRPFVRKGGLRPPGPLNLGGDRALPALAKRSFRAQWSELEREGGSDGLSA